MSRLVLNSVWRKKNRPRIVRVTGCTANGAAIVRACEPDGTFKNPKGQKMLLWPHEFHHFVCLGMARDCVSSQSSQGE